MMKEPQRLPKAGLNVAEFIGGAKTAAADAAPANGKARKKKGLPAEGVVRATYDLPASVHEAFKIRAVQEKRSMRDLLLQAVEETFGIQAKAPRKIK